MKALCDRKGLLAAFGMVGGVAPARSPKQILQNLKFTVDPDAGATLLATDLEVGIRYRVAGVRSERAGSAILPSAKFGSILATTPDKDIQLELDGDQLLIKGLRFSYRLPSEDPNLFPDVPDFAADQYHVVAAADLKRSIRRTMFATDVESTRYALGGVLVELTGDSMAMVGTDGRRLARMTTAVETENDAELPAGMPVVPVKALKLIERNLVDDDPPVHLAIQGTTAVLIRTHNAVIYSRLVEGRFPRYQDVFPTKVDVKIPIEVGPLRQAVEQASIVTSDESRGVDFSFGEGVLTLNSQAADVGQSTIEMPIPYDGKAVEITFDPRYLIDALKNLHDDATITAELIDHKHAAVFRTDDGYSYVVMPLTRDR
jgi:DNA polymerase-3 subunit beta